MNEVEEKRKKRNEVICKEWVETSKRRMEAGEKPTAIMTAIAAKWGISMQNVLYILKTAGVYNGAKQL